jgi:hypothetical protein
VDRIKVGSRVAFSSPEYGLVEGKVVEIRCGLYGITSLGIPGTFWRDRKALKLIIIAEKVQK